MGISCSQFDTCKDSLELTSISPDIIKPKTINSLENSTSTVIACIKLQSFWRGYKTRKHTNLIKKLKRFSKRSKIINCPKCKSSGKDIFYLDKGILFKGDILYKKRTGYGEEIHSDGSHYKGFLRNGQKDGFGVLVLKDGSKLSGQWKENKLSGEAYCDWITGKEYLGQMRNGIKHGRGFLISPSGEEYSGLFFQDDFLSY